MIGMASIHDLQGMLWPKTSYGLIDVVGPAGALAASWTLWNARGPPRAGARCELGMAG